MYRFVCAVASLVVAAFFVVGCSSDSSTPSPSSSSSPSSSAPSSSAPSSKAPEQQAPAPAAPQHGGGGATTPHPHATPTKPLPGQPGSDTSNCEGSICKNPNHGAGTNPNENGGDSSNCEGTVCTNPNHGAGTNPSENGGDPGDN